MEGIDEEGRGGSDQDKANVTVLDLRCSHFCEITNVLTASR